MQQLTLKKLTEYNLFSEQKNTLILRALFVSKSEIKVTLKKHPKENLSIILFNHNNSKITDIKALYNKNVNEIKLTGNFNFQTNYKLQINNDEINVILNPEINGILDTHFYSDEDDFGVLIKDNKAFFKLWSPPAVKVELLLFNRNQDQLKTSKQIFLKNTKLGIWEYTLNPKDFGLPILDGTYYQYKISAYGKDRIALDPYAKSMAIFDKNSDDITGKGIILDIKSSRAFPKSFKKNYSNFKFIDNETDIIVYEINVRDFTIQKGVVDEKISGTFKGLTSTVEYLKSLGVTHVQLMPVNKAYTQNELNKDFTGIDSEESNYNWGYDPINYFTLEGRYSTNPYNSYSRIIEFREMVQSLHDEGIGVILDVVFNHTYIADTFENIAPGCYYRHKNNYQISGHTGAGATVESRRKQVRKFIIDVLKFYVTEYHIDGFRFDLMSFTDKETMRQIREQVGLIYNPNNANELILQGEAWEFTDLKEDAYIKTDYESLNIGIFNDSFRDSVAGNGYQQGFIHGNTSETPRLASAIIAGINSYDTDCLAFNKKVFFNHYNLFAKNPSDCLNFLSVHDGLTLWDKINLSVNDDSKKERLNLMKFAYSILLSSQGKVLIHGGDEILRTKPLSNFDNEKDRALTSENINTELDVNHFHENSYSSNDYTNMFRWDRLTNEYSNYANTLLEYVKGLIKLRRSISAFRFNSTENIYNNIQFLDEDYKKTNIVHSFKSHRLEKLTIIFKNGIANEKYYLTGEVHKKNDNPVKNPLEIVFDKEGTSKITFSKEEIQKFNLQKWENDRNLNIKLVKTPGEWDYLEYAYTDFGYNTICPESIDENFEVEINLNKIDFENIKPISYIANNYIAYIINKPYKSKNDEFDFKKILVIHNSRKLILDFPIQEISTPEEWKVIIDNKNSGIEEIQNSDVKITKGHISVPKKSTAVIIQR